MGPRNCVEGLGVSRVWPGTCLVLAADMRGLVQFSSR